MMPWQPLEAPVAIPLAPGCRPPTFSERTSRRCDRDCRSRFWDICRESRASLQFMPGSRKQPIELQVT